MPSPLTPEPDTATGGLLERARELSTLGGWLTEAQQTSHGRFVFVSGEAGVGKTALLRQLSAATGERTRVLWGACDPMFTPQPLGPLLDVAEAAGGETVQLVAAGAKSHPIVGALLRELAGPAPTLLVIEDVHWADEATLDVLALLARRIGSVPVLVLASYRDDEVDRRAPLRIVLGDLGTAPDVERMAVARLSPEAVATLAAPHAIDADALYRVTDGNAFFVTEVLAAGQDHIPATVRDAVLARTARLRAAARKLLDAAAVLLPPVDIEILNALAPDADGALEECLTAGMLVATPGGVAFRHELSRLAVDESLSPDVKVALHRQALAAMEARSSGRGDSALLAHHAEAADDADAVLRFAPLAARQAAAAGAHREAAAQYGRALWFSSAAPLQLRAELLDAHAAECNLIGEFSEAIASSRAAVDCWQELGDRREEARARTALAWPLWVLGAREEAENEAHRAISVLEEDAPTPELIQAYLSVASMAYGREALEEAVSAGSRALDVATDLNDEAGAVEARVQIDGANLMRRARGAHEDLQRTLALAQREGLERPAAYALCYLAHAAETAFEYALASAYSDQGIDYCTEHDLESFRPYLLAVRGRAELARGQWTEAAESAAAVLATHGSGIGSVVALTTLGRVRARRGDPGAWELLDEAFRLGAPCGEIGRLAPVALARAEAAWLEGRLNDVVEATELALEVALRYDVRYALGELAVWRRRAGVDEPVPAAAAEPYATQLAGDWQTAAELWSELGAPYEAALALADGDDEESLKQALAELQRLGAAPAAAIVSRRLRLRGARGLPRGPRPRTRENPANLTPREMEVLALVADGRRNGDIAETLFLSQKTVSHHVSAILRKLDVKTRGEAGAAFVRLGAPGQDR